MLRCELYSVAMENNTDRESSKAADLGLAVIDFAILRLLLLTMMDRCTAKLKRLRINVMK